MTTLLPTPAPLGQASSDGSGFQSALDAMTQQAGGALPTQLKVQPVASATADNLGKVAKNETKLAVEATASTDASVAPADTDISTVQALPSTPEDFQQPVVAPPIAGASAATPLASPDNAQDVASTTDTNVATADESVKNDSKVVTDTNSSSNVLVTAADTQAAALRTLPSNRESSVPERDASDKTSIDTVKTSHSIASKATSTTGTTIPKADKSGKIDSKVVVDPVPSTAVSISAEALQVAPAQTQSGDQSTSKAQVEVTPKAAPAVPMASASADTQLVSPAGTSKAASATKNTNTVARPIDKSDKKDAKVAVDTVSPILTAVPVLPAVAEVPPVQTVSFGQIVSGLQGDSTSTIASSTSAPISDGQAYAQLTSPASARRSSFANETAAPNFDRPENNDATGLIDAASSTTIPVLPADSQTVPLQTLSFDQIGPRQDGEAISTAANTTHATDKPNHVEPTARVIAANSADSTNATHVAAAPVNRGVSAKTPSISVASATSSTSAKEAVSDQTADTATSAQTQAPLPANASAPLFGADLPAQAAGDTAGLSMNLPLPAASSSKAAANSSDDKSAVKQSLQSTTQTGANSVTAAPTKTKVTASTTTESASHRAQDNSQSSQQPQSGASDKPATMPAVADVTAAQPQTVAVHANAHSVGVQSDSQADVTDATRQNALNADATATRLDRASAPSSVNTAAVLKTMAGSEMHLGMHSAEFGNISIRTTVSTQQMMTQISTDHSDLGQAISAHVSSAQTKISDDLGMRATISVNGQSTSSFADSGDSSSRQQRAMQQTFQAGSQPLPAELDVGLTPGPLIGSGDTYRLDIRA